MLNIRFFVFFVISFVVCSDLLAEGICLDSFEHIKLYERSPLLIRPSRFADLKFPYFPGFRTYPEDYSNGLVSQGDDYIAYEVDMTDYALSTFVTKENAEAFAATNDSLYVRNVIKYVRCKYKDGVVNDCFVLYIPDKVCIDKLDVCRRSSFTKACDGFSGLVCFFSKRGKMMYGYEYKYGRIVGKIMNSTNGNKLHLFRMRRQCLSDEIGKMKVIPYVLNKKDEEEIVTLSSSQLGDTLKPLMHKGYLRHEDIIDDSRRAFNRYVINEYIKGVFSDYQKDLYYSLFGKNKYRLAVAVKECNYAGEERCIKVRLPKLLYETMDEIQVNKLWNIASNLEVPFNPMCEKGKESTLYFMVYFLFDRGSEDDNISDSEIEGALPVIVPVK